MNAKFHTINKIAGRFLNMSAHYGVYGYDKLDIIMYLEAADKAVGLDFDGLLHATHGNFGHDLFGIINHLDHATGKLTDGFTPRYAK